MQLAQKTDLHLPMVDAYGNPTPLASSLANFPLIRPSGTNLSSNFIKKFHISELRDENSGAAYLVTSKVAQGSYGKFRIGVSAQGGLVAIKELRYIPSRNQPTDGTKKTKVTLSLAARHEYKLMERIHGDAMVVGMVRTAKANFLVMHLMDSDLFTANIALQAQPHSANTELLLANFAEQAHQLLPQLVRIHQECNLMVADIKPANVLVDKQRGFKLADFGLAVDVDPQTGLTRSQPGYTLGYAAPEYSYKDMPMTQKADVYAMGLTLLAALETSDMPKNPFLDLGIHMARGYSATEAAEEIHSHLIGWWDDLQWRGKTTPGGMLAALRPGKSRFDDYFLSLAKFYPSYLCAAMIEHILAPDPQDRWDSQQLQQWAANMHRDLGRPALVAAYLTGQADRDQPRQRFIRQLQAHAHAVQS